MKYQSLPKNLSTTSRQSVKEVGEVGWSSFLRPIDQSMPEHSFQCECAMCNVYGFKKFKQALEEQQTTINSKIRARVTTSNAVRQQSLENNYHWILKRLMIPHHKIATSGLSIHITETLFFKDGEASQFFLVKQIEDPTIKRIPKQKLTNPYIQKVMSDRRRKYKDFIRVKTGRKKAQQKKKLLFGQKEVKKEIKDAVLLRYVDGYEQLLTENQFLSMFLRRKQDPIWRQIMSIRNFVNITNPEEKNSAYVVIKFRRDKIEDEQLFERAKTLMKVYGEYITEGDQKFISSRDQNQFRKDLQSRNQRKYAEYLAYQIVNFIEYFYDQEIKTLVVGFYFDEVGHAFLHEVHKLEAKSLIKFEWTNQIYRKRMDEEEIKVLESKLVSQDVSMHKGTMGMIQMMQSAYEKMRDRFGLTVEDKDDQEEVANNSFFKTLHPEFKYNISDVLKNPHLTLADFKKDYMGFKQQKKPIIKEFTSNMIKTLHLTSPKLRTTNPHDFIQSPVKYAIPKFSQTERKKDSVILSPLKLDTNRKLYQTLPVREMN